MLIHLCFLLNDPKNYDLFKIKTPELLYEKVLKLFEEQNFQKLKRNRIVNSNKQWQ